MKTATTKILRLLNEQASTLCTVAHDIHKSEGRELMSTLFKVLPELDCMFLGIQACLGEIMIASSDNIWICR
jgi:hypothetical protein